MSTSASTEPAGTGDAPPGDEPPVAPGKGIHKPVFYPAAGLILVFVVVAAVVPGRLNAVIQAANTTVVNGLGWYYVLLIAVLVGFSLWLAFSRYGEIKLARDDDADREADFGIVSWFSMLFAAGMGIGLVFWGAAEPLNYLAAPRPGVTGSPEDLAQQAMNQTFLHWGVHAWAIYVVVGLAIAYAIHRKGRPVSIRWALEPLFGDRVRGRLGDVIDVLAVVGTLFGVATSLGFGVSQIGAGFEFLGAFEATDLALVLLIVGITAIAATSVVSGVDRGIKWLSNGNLILAAVVLVLILALGPTLFLLREFVQSLGSYARDVLALTFNTSAYQGTDGEQFLADWTTYYWGWWISWSPFVGVFIARISRGRTVREFVLGVMLVPTAVTFLWFSVLGGSALYRELFGEGGLIVNGEVDNTTTLFTLLDGLPGGTVLVGVTILLIVIFFVTSSDSGSLVIDMLASGGNPDPPTWSRIFWSVMEGAVAAVLLVAGGLLALQTMAILVAVPFSVVIVLMVVSLQKALSGEHRAIVRLERAVRRREMVDHVGEELGSRVAGSDLGPPFGEQLAEALSNGDADADEDPEVAAEDETDARLAGSGSRGD